MDTPALPTPGVRPGLVMALLGLLSFVPTACGGDRDRLEGTWVRNDFPSEKGQKPCAEELELDFGQFVSRLRCRLTEGTFGQKVTIGQYRHQETRLFVSAQQSSCENEPRGEVTWFITVDRDKLHKTVGNVTTTYQRGKAEVGGVIVLGCFDAELKNFDEHAIVNLP
jgi:hypothetical protein